MSCAAQTRFDANTLIPELLRDAPQLRAVFDRYGLHGCGGRLGPHETIGFFARAHDVAVPRLLADLRTALEKDAAPIRVANPADQIYRRFFVAGIVIVLTLGATWGAWLLLQIALGGSFRAAGLHAINAHGHAQIFGWVGLFVMGFAYQAFPRFKHTELRWPGLAFASWWMLLSGLLVRCVFEPLAATNAIWIGLVIAAATVEAIAITICVGIVFGTWRRAAKPFMFYDGYIVSALMWFLVQAVADAMYVAATLLVDPAWKTDLVATWQAPLRDLQIHGFAMLMIFGVSLRMLHHIYGFKKPSERLCLALLPLLNLAIVGEANGLVLMRIADHGFAALWYASVALLTAASIALVVNCGLFAKANEPHRTLKFVRAAYVWLLISLGLTLLMPVYQFGLLPSLAPESTAVVTGFSHAYYGAIRHAITVGFISMMIVGVAARVVPTLNGLDGKYLPQLWGPFLLINLGCTLRVAGQIATDVTGSAFPIAGASGILEVIGLAIWGVHLVRIMSGFYRPRGMDGQPADAIAVVPGQSIVAAHSVGEVLDIYPELLSSFIEHGFRPLANPVIRRRLANGITIGRACRLARVDVSELLESLNRRMATPTQTLPVIDFDAIADAPAATCSCCTERKVHGPQ